MEKNIKFIRVLFAVPWLIFGVQHFMYAAFVATLVPPFMPAKLFFAYFTGAAMIAAGISFIVNRFARLAAILLGAMLWIFILLIHVPALSSNPLTAGNWTRPLQDVALACACWLLAETFSRSAKSSALFDRLIKISRFIFAVILVGIGVQQFFNLDFVTAKIPLYFPGRLFWVYLTGVLMIATGVSVIINKKARQSAMALGIFLIAVNLLNHGYLLANNLHEPLLWTAAMLDLAVTGGVFILANRISVDNGHAE